MAPAAWPPGGSRVRPVLASGDPARFHSLDMSVGQYVTVIIVLGVEGTATRAAVDLPFWLSKRVGGEVTLQPAGKLEFLVTFGAGIRRFHLL